MSETATETATETKTEGAEKAAESKETAAATATDEKKAEAGEGALGDAGKKALDAMKAKWKAAETRANERDQAASALQAKLDGKEAEHEAEKKTREAEQAALKKADERILKAEVRAAAATKLADPADALRFIDLSEFEVGSDGEVDAQAISAAIEDLISTKPYLAAQGGKRFQGAADGGARKDASKPSQLTKADMASMSAEQIDAAHNEGRFTDLLGP